MWSQLKLLKHKSILKEILSDEVSIPTHIQFEFTESCNYSCVFCPWHGENEGQFKNIDFTGKRFFDFERFIQLIDEMEELGVKAISITGAGENLIHPKFDKFIEKLANSTIEFAITSNFGVKLSNSAIKNLLKAKWIRWSVNASDEITYNQTNRPKVNDAYFISKNNISNLIQSRTDEKVHVGASFVIGDYNKHNIKDITKFVKNLEIDSLSFRPDTPMLRKEKIYEYDRQTKIDLKECEKESDKDFKIFVNYGRLEDSLQIKDKDLRCYYSNHSIHIISNGDVYPCCMTRYDKKYKFGNIMDKSFKEFWFSKKRINNYKNIFMKNCPSCHHTNINKVLKNFYEENEQLDNFI
ncbi:MAG: radical SAM protein [Campylobacterota bacterium]|nr:radical SAM protein [Campylobacterota bacterium]